MASKLAIIAGTSFMNSPLFGKEKIVETEYGKVSVFCGEKALFIPRHGVNYVLPGKIPHKANIAALKKLSCKNAIGLFSVGSLKPSIKPGTILVPDDYINLYNPITLYENEMKCITPEFSSKLRELIVGCLSKSVFHNGGVYFQSAGPRLETKAEIRMMSVFADVVGMTLGQEATVAQEAGLNYAAVCSVDNFANGINSPSLNMDAILEGAKDNRDRLKRMIEDIIDRYTETGA